MSSSMLAQALLDYGSDSDENIADQADELPLLEDSAKNDTTTEIMYGIYGIQEYISIFQANLI